MIDRKGRIEAEDGRIEPGKGRTGAGVDGRDRAE